MKKSNTEVPEGFKMTELGPLPEEWKVVSLSDVCSLRKESVEPENAKDVIYVGLEHIIPENLKINSWGKPSNVKSTKNFFYKGDILYGKLRPYLNKVAIAHTNGICSTDIMVFSALQQKVIRNYLANFMHTKPFLEYATMTMTGVNHPRTSWSKLKKFKIPLAPLSEQKKIAAVLSTVQEAKEKTKAVIESARELKKSLMKHLGTYGPAPVEEAENVPLKETDIGSVPKEWEVANVEEAVESIEYGYSISIPRNEDKEGIPIVSTADITRDGRILYSQIRRIVPPKKLPERLILRNGDILFNWRNSPELIGKTAIFQQNQNKEHCIYASFILRIRSNEIKSNNIYIKYLLNYYREIGVFLKLARRAVNQANYNKNELNALKIPLPPIPVQQKIAEILSSVDRKIEVEENKKKALEELFKTLLNNLLTAKIRVSHLEI